MYCTYVEKRKNSLPPFNFEMKKSGFQNPKNCSTLL